jgi:hypothetical protein
MAYASECAKQISAARELARQVRRIAEAISLDTDRARLLGHAEDLERSADEQEHQQSATQRPVNVGQDAASAAEPRP